ncbi:hypothetical protein AVEN_209225-3 [Araneus ventricosus]|uniref:CRAL/TRIO N-terminal domain-containing protein n=1 Tax=Araneus ventricosus TaxID=182803 RepID=A0A4Y2LYP0_ARAVE|nr:hypothetical protein AVEN_209225-3 [Araneus ventricosus]
MDKITDEEKKVMDELRERTINDLTPKLLEDDSLFYRFAKARDFNVVESEAMLRKVLLKYGASSFVCFDKEGSAVRIQDWGHLDGKACCLGRGHLDVRSRLRGHGVPGSKPDSTEDPSCMGSVAHYIIRCGQASFRWLGAEVWRRGACPVAIIVISPRLAPK